MVFWCGMKLVTGVVVFGTSKEGLWSRPRSAPACALPGNGWYELQSDLQRVATCAYLGGSLERLCCKLRPVVTIVGLRAPSKRYRVYQDQVLFVSGL